MASSLSITLINETDTAINEGTINETLELILRRLKRVGRVNIELLIVGDKKITELNRRHRQIDKPTDVLSFSQAKDPHNDLIGSLVISIETAQKQADQAGIPLIEEIKTLAGHGFLHLLGYHHS